MKFTYAPDGNQYDHLMWDLECEGDTCEIMVTSSDRCISQDLSLSSISECTQFNKTEKPDGISVAFTTENSQGTLALCVKPNWPETDPVNPGTYPIFEPISMDNIPKNCLFELEPAGR